MADDTEELTAVTDSAVEVAVFAPLRQNFSYRCPVPAPALGVRVRVPFGRGQRIGIVVGFGPTPEGTSLKEIDAVIDPEPLLSPALQSLLHFGSAYYQHPLGEVWATALPSLLCRGRPLPGADDPLYLCNAAAIHSSARLGPRQRALLQLLQESGPLRRQDLPATLRPALPGLLARDILRAEAAPPPLLAVQNSPHALHAEQREAVAALRAAHGFSVFLLDGVTGSGKTEVYLEAARPHLEAGRQVLFLVPEIGLTPQLLGRCRSRFGAAVVAAYHSGQSEAQRLRVWHGARSGQLRVLVGTRSALFLPLAHPGLIVVDEEHDPSFKQQSGWLYSARDLAIRRAQLESIPIVLGSATPSLESLQNAYSGKYRHLRLRQRATAMSLPPMTILPMRRRLLQAGLSIELLKACGQTLDAGHQVLLFLNRRGYAPALLCHDCGTVLFCPRCSAPLTWHRRPQRLRCHHCGHEATHPGHCPQCASVDLRAVGAGTEQLEDYLQQRFPEVPVPRIDRDCVTHAGQLESLLARVHSAGPAILVGTQMLAKGHHFPRVTLVGIVHVDQSLFSADFRATERLAQTVLQVAGRAGRGNEPGRVLLQSHVPEHPLLALLQAGDYGAIAHHLLEERRSAQLPPFRALALLRAEAHRPERVQAFLEAVAGQAPAELEISGPFPSLLERRAGFHRAELWLEAADRTQLQRALKHWLREVGKQPEGRRVRWVVDVDPLNF